MILAGLAGRGERELRAWRFLRPALGAKAAAHARPARFTKRAGTLPGFDRLPGDEERAVGSGCMLSGVDGRIDSVRTPCLRSLLRAQAHAFAPFFSALEPSSRLRQPSHALATFFSALATEPNSAKAKAGDSEGEGEQRERDRRRWRRRRERDRGRTAKARARARPQAVRYRGHACLDDEPSSARTESRIRGCARDRGISVRSHRGVFSSLR